MAVGDWVPCLNYGSQVLGDFGNGMFSVDNVLVGVGPDNIGDFPDIATVEVEEEVMTKRVVGWVAHRCAVVEPGPVIVHERIRVGLRDAGGVMSFFAEDLNDSDQANEPFLWERVAVIDVGTGGTTWPQPDFGHVGWAQIDVRVSRRLRRQDVLVYSVHYEAVQAQLDPTDVMSVFPWLRTWARALGT